MMITLEDVSLCQWICVKNMISQNDKCYDLGLYKHFIIHTGEKPLYCNKCDFRLCNYNHIRIHTGEKSLYCDKCDIRL